MCDSSLCLGWGCGQGPRAWVALLSWIHFFPGVQALASGWIGARGVGVALLNWFFFPVHTCTSPQEMVVSALARGRAGAKLAPFPLSAHTLIDIGSSSLAGSSAGAAGALGPSWQSSQSIGKLSVCCFQAVIESKQVCAWILQEWSLSFLQPSRKLHWFPNQLRGLIFLVPDSRAGCLICGSNPSTPREDL